MTLSSHYEVFWNQFHNQAQMEAVYNDYFLHIVKKKKRMGKVLIKNLFENEKKADLFLIGAKKKHDKLLF